MRRRLATMLAVGALLSSMLIVTGGIALAANPAATLDQCANGSVAAPNVPACNPQEWVNGNLGASKATYAEGDTVPYRMRFSNLATTGPVHKVTIEWDTTKSGKHALDYLRTYNQTVTTANPCAGVTGCSLASPSDTEPIPLDPQVDPGDPSGTGANGGQLPGVFTIWGGQITGITASVNSGYVYANGAGFTGDKSARIEINFTASVANPVLAWGGHIATRQAWGAANSAVTIPGSPYHMRLIALDGAGGNQDRSLSAAAVIFPASITIIKDVVGGQAAQDFGFTATGGLTPVTFSLDDDANATLPSAQPYSNIRSFGSYTIDEAAVTHWALSFNTPPCTVTSANGGSQSASSTGVTITLNEGENVSCTFLNTHNVATPTVNTQVKTTGLDGAVGGNDDVNVANGGNVAIGTEAYDTASLSSGTADAGGTVDYYVEKGDATCTIAGATSLGTGKAVTNGVAAASNEYTLATAGTYYFWAVYSGDGNNVGATSGCSTELVVVDRTQSSTTTQVKLSSNDSNVGDGASIGIGVNIYDTNSVTGSNPTGTVTYYWQKQLATDLTPNCLAGTQLGVAKSVGTASDAISFANAGTYELWAVYAGDDNNLGSRSLCGSETVVVDKNTTSTSTQVKKSVALGHPNQGY